MGSGGVYGSVLVRLEGDGQEVWEGKVRAWEEVRFLLFPLSYFTCLSYPS